MSEAGAARAGNDATSARGAEAVVSTPAHVTSESQALLSTNWKDASNVTDTSRLHSVAIDGAPTAKTGEQAKAADQMSPNEKAALDVGKSAEDAQDWKVALRGAGSAISQRLANEGVQESKGPEGTTYTDKNGYSMKFDGKNLSFSKDGKAVDEKEGAKTFADTLRSADSKGESSRGLDAGQKPASSQTADTAADNLTPTQKQSLDIGKQAEDAQDWRVALRGGGAVISEKFKSQGVSESRGPEGTTYTNTDGNSMTFDGHNVTFSKDGKPVSEKEAATSFARVLQASEARNSEDSGAPAVLKNENLTANQRAGIEIGEKAEDGQDWGVALRGAGYAISERFRTQGVQESRGPAGTTYTSQDGHAMHFDGRKTTFSNNGQPVEEKEGAMAFARILRQSGN